MDPSDVSWHWSKLEKTPWSMLQPSDRDGGLIFLRQLQSCLDLTTSVWNWWKISEVSLIQKHLETSSGKPKSRTKNEQRHLPLFRMGQPTRSLLCVALCLQCRHSWTKCHHLTSILREKKAQSLEYEAGDDDGDASHALRPFLTMLLPGSTPIYPDLSRSIPIYPALTAFATISWFSSLHFLMRCFLSRHYVQWHLWEPTIINHIITIY